MFLWCVFSFPLFHYHHLLPLLDPSKPTASLVCCDPAVREPPSRRSQPGHPERATLPPRTSDLRCGRPFTLVRIVNIHQLPASTVNTTIITSLRSALYQQSHSSQRYLPLLPLCSGCARPFWTTTRPCRLMRGPASAPGSIADQEPRPPKPTVAVLHPVGARAQSSRKSSRFLLPSVSPSNINTKPTIRPHCC